MAAGSTITRVVDGLHRIRLGFVSAYLLESDDGLVLVDCGEAGRSGPIAQAVASLGRAVGQISHILVTHHHADHTGSLADLARQADAPVYVHPADADVVRGERAARGLALPGIAGRLLGPVLARIGPDQPEPSRVDHELQDDERLAIGGGIQVIHTPGHTLGHTAFLVPRDGGLLIAGDAATNIRRVRSGDHWAASIVTEDRAAARSSFDRLADLDFDVAVFGHGSPILSGAAAQFRAARR
jgi:glyoxylase-like metal-dependent hydrolase (beta-lactamase superfamily II)